MKNPTKIFIMRYSWHLIAVALLLVAVFFGITCLERPAVVHAETKKQYISELRVFQNTAGKELDAESKALQSQGYSVDTVNNLMEGADHFYDYEGSTYLAYKTTTNPDEAITDVSLMNMVGPYSFAEYGELQEDMKEMADKRIEFMLSGIKGFRTNYGLQTAPAIYAHKMMNKYLEDDSNTLMGDFLLKTPLENVNTDNTSALRKVVMQAQSTILSVIDKNLAIACLPPKTEKSWIDKLSSMTADDIDLAKRDLDIDKKAEMITSGFDKDRKDELGAMEEVAGKLKVFHEFYNIVYEKFSADTQEELDEKMKDPAKKAQFDELVKSYFPDDGAVDYAQTAYMYSILSCAKYENDNTDRGFPYCGFEGKKSLIAKNVLNGSLLDLFLSVLDDEFDYMNIYPLVKSLTDQQIDMIFLSGFEQAILLSSSDEKVWEEINKEMKVQKLDENGTTVDDIPVVSVYSGVDRTIFTPDGIALTSEAARRQMVDVSDTWYGGNLSKDTTNIFYGLFAVSGALTLGSGIILAKRMKDTIYVPSALVGFDEVDDIAAVFDKVDKMDMGFMWGSFGKYKFQGLWRSAVPYVFGVCMAILSIAIVVYFSMQVDAYNDPPVYSEKPRIIYDNISDKKGNSKYIRYDAVTNQFGQMCDVRDKTSKEWVVLYTSKDKAVGNPVLAGSFTVSPSALKGYSPINRISDQDAYGIQEKGAYKMFYKTDPDAYPKTGSTFSVGAFTLALCGGIFGGAALGFLATWFIMRRKKKPADKLVQTKIE